MVNATEERLDGTALIFRLVDDNLNEILPSMEMNTSGKVRL